EFDTPASPMLRYIKKKCPKYTSERGPYVYATPQCTRHNEQIQRNEGSPTMGNILPVFILVTLAILFGLLVMGITAIIGPKKPTPEKLAPYECGIQEIEAPKHRFSVKYLLTGMLFIVFDIEIVSFYPLAILMRQLGLFGLIELLIFLAILMVGYIYVWRKGAFTWE